MTKDLENRSLPKNDDSHSLVTRPGITKRLVLAAQLLLACCLSPTALAATYTVNSTSDLPLASTSCAGSGTCTLRAAIRAANASVGVADTINLPAGTYTLSLTGTNEDQAATGDLDISDDLTIVAVDGSNNPILDPSQTKIDGNGTDRVFHILTGATVSISNLTIQNGFVNADTNNNVSNGGGGGGGIYNSGALTLTNCVIQNNVVTATSASGAGGGGIQTTGIAGTGPNTIRTIIIRSVIQNNSAPLGGGVRNFFGSMQLDLTDVYNNQATQYSGGGIQNASGNMSVQRSTIRYNTALENGGGVDNLDAMTITESSIYLNQTSGILTGGVVTSGGAGGGVSNGSAGSLTIANTTISQNQAYFDGGGLFNQKNVTLANSTIYDNSVAAGGSGTEVFACGNQDTTSTCATGIWVDDTDHSKGVLIHTNFINTIVGNSSTSDNCNGDPTDLVFSNGHNLETANSCGFTATGDKVNISSAGLFSDVFKWHGGDLSGLFTLPIDNTSPAYNAGDYAYCSANIVTDERHFVRDDGSCDIGAYEYGATVKGANVLDLALDITDQVSLPNNGSVQATITFSVVNKGPLQATNVVLNGDIPFQSGLSLISLGPGTDSVSSTGSCSQSVTGFTCTLPSMAAYDSANFYVALLATKAMKFQIGGQVDSDESDNYHPDNSKSITIDIPTVANSSVSGNNFAGASGGGGTIGWWSLALLLPLVARRGQRRKQST